MKAVEVCFPFEVFETDPFFWFCGFLNFPFFFKKFFVYQSTCLRLPQTFNLPKNRS